MSLTFSVITWANRLLIQGFCVETIATMFGKLVNKADFGMNSVQAIDDFLATEIDPSILGTVVGIFVAVLLPTVILLLETVSAKSWDRAVLINKVINLRKVFYGVCLMTASTLFWRIPHVSPFLLVCYAAGLGIMIQVIWISIKWMMDWTESSKNGVKYLLRRQMLTDERINSDERLKIWQQYLGTLTLRDGRPVEGFGDGELFFEVFEQNYYDLLQDRGELLQITMQYMEDVFKSPRSHESEFLEFAFAEFFRSKVSGEAEVYLYWRAILDNEFDNAANDNRRAIYLFDSVMNQTPKNLELDSKFRLGVLASLLFKLILKRNRGILDKQWLEKTIWKIDSHQIIEHDVRGLAQACLLDEFWKHVNEIDHAGGVKSNIGEMGMALDNAATVIFQHVDSIILRRIYNLFRVSNFRGYTENWEQILLDSINRQPIFGYYSDEPAIWTGNDSEAEKLFFQQRWTDAVEESIRISTMTLPLLRVADTGWIIRKIRTTLQAILQKTDFDSNNILLTADSVKADIRLTQMIAYDVYSTSWRQQSKHSIK